MHGNRCGSRQRKDDKKKEQRQKREELKRRQTKDSRAGDRGMEMEL